MLDDSRNFLEAITGYANSNVGTPSSTDKPIRIGTVDQYYTDGPARVLFDGETVMSQRGYAWIGSYTPVGGDRVVLVPVGSTYMIGGKITSALAFPRYVTASLQNGWSSYDEVNFHPASFTKTSDGVVKVSGMIKGGTVTNGTVLFTLPSGFRPTQGMCFPAISNDVVASVYVDVDGTVSIASDKVAAAWLALDNITFPTDPTLSWSGVSLLNSFTQGRTIGYTKDGYNRIWVRGSVTKSPTPTADTDIFNLPAGYRPAKGHHMPSRQYTSGSVSDFAFHEFTAAGIYRWKNGSVGSQSVSLDNSMLYEASVTSGWTAATLQNAWAVFDGVNLTTPEYRKDNGLVFMHGVVKAGTMSASIFTLNSGFRPSKRLIFETPSNAAHGRVDIYPDGTVVPKTGSNGWFSLDGICFTAEA